MRFRNVLLIGVSLLLSSCTPKLDEKEFIGVWKSNDGASLVLEHDGKIELRNFNLANVFYDRGERVRVVNIQGNWSFESKDQEINVLADDFTFPLGISGEGAFGNNPPWHLFVWIGDPDDMNKYKFEKQQE